MVVAVINLGQPASGQTSYVLLPRTDAVEAPLTMVGMVRVITAVLAGPTGRLGPPPWWSTSS
jgi:hypothetical protein